MEFLDNIFRFGAIGLYSWLIVLAFRDYRHHLRGRLAVSVSVCTVAYLVCSMPDIRQPDFGIEVVLFPLSVSNGIVVWLFCLSQFDDHFEIKAWHWAVLAVKITFGYLFSFSELPDQQLLFRLGVGVSSVIAIGTLLHLAFVTWQGRKDDLMPARLRFRRLFALLVITISLGILSAELFVLKRGTAYIDYLLLLQAVTFFGVAMFVLWRMSGPDGIEIFVFSPSDSKKPVKVSKEDRHDLKALNSLITDNALLEPGLSIARLAQAAGMPEHRLRRLINRHLEFRNFSDFLNHHRVRAAQDRLSDASVRHVPVLTIAMELGYGSLGPFNRAFKERTGQTPSEYRRQVLAESAAS